MPHEKLTVTQTIHLPDGAVVFFATTTRGTPVTVWLGEPPQVDDIRHPSIPQVLGRGRSDMGLCWIEERPSSFRLVDLSLPLAPETAHFLGSRLTHDLADLHSAGLVHGSIATSTVLVSGLGRCTFIGAGRIPGSIEEDLAALVTLLEQLGGAPLPSQALSSASSIARVLDQRASEDTAILDALRLPSEPPTTGVASLTLELEQEGWMDEIQFEVGADAHGHGILDRWDHHTDESDLTDDSTESVGLSYHHAETRQHLFSELTAALDQACDDPQTVDLDFRAAINEEPLDPIVPLEGLSGRPLHNPLSSQERTAEIASPDVTEPREVTGDELTGFTGPIPLQQSVLTGLLMAAVLGMIGAVVMLALVWVIIGDVF